MNRWLLAAGLLGVLPAGAVRAQATPPVVVALEYSAPPGCPEAGSFREQVLGRTRRVSFGEPSAAGSLIWKVEIAATSGGSRGTLRVLDQRPSSAVSPGGGA